MTSPRASAQRLDAWFRKARREMPWRGSPDPYAVWVSEIMLQQTRVDTVVPYFDRFLRAFPNVRVGAAWWFNDMYRGINAQLDELMETGAFASSVGMLTDSRTEQPQKAIVPMLVTPSLMTTVLIAVKYSRQGS